MPTVIIDVDVFTEPVTTPSTNEDADEAAWLASMQQLANRTRNNRVRLDGLPTLVANQVMARGSTGVTEGKASSDVTLSLLALTTIIAHADALHTKSTNIASATTTNLANATGMFAHITGTNTIDSFGTAAAGVVRFLEFNQPLTLTHNGVSMILPTATNILTAARDNLLAISEGGGNWRIVNYQRSDGSALMGGGTLQAAYIGGNTVAIDAANGSFRINNSVDSTGCLLLERTFAGAGRALRVTMDAVTTQAGVLLDHAGTGDALVINHTGSAGTMIDADATGGAVAVDIKVSGSTVFGIDAVGAVTVAPPSGEDFAVTSTGAGAAALSTVDGLATLIALGTGDAQVASVGGGNTLINSVLGEVRLSNVGSNARALGDMVVDGDLVAATGFIDGFHIANDGVTPDEIIDIDPGRAISDDSTLMITSAGTLSPNITAGGAGGLDSGASTEAANTWYAVYVIEDSAGVNATDALFSLSVTVGGISFPAGYDKARRVGMIRTDATSDILIFTQARGAGANRYTYWREEVLVQTAGTATAFTNTATSAATRVPVTATRQMVDIRSLKVGGGSGTPRVEVIPDGWNEAAGGMFWNSRCGNSAAADITTNNTVEMPVGPAQLLRYRVQAAGEASADVTVLGYEDALL